MITTWTLKQIAGTTPQHQYATSHMPIIVLKFIFIYNGHLMKFHKVIMNDLDRIKSAFLMSSLKTC